MVIGEKLFTSGSSTGSIPKSPSFHSSLELAEATGRQITSINCNIFDFAAEMTSTTTDRNQQNHQQTDQQQTDESLQPQIRNGLVARTIQTFSRLQNEFNQDNSSTQPQTWQPMTATTIENVTSSEITTCTTSNQQQNGEVDNNENKTSNSISDSFSTAAGVSNSSNQNNTNSLFSLNHPNNLGFELNSTCSNKAQSTANACSNSSSFSNFDLNLRTNFAVNSNEFMFTNNEGTTNTPGTTQSSNSISISRMNEANNKAIVNGTSTTLDLNFYQGFNGSYSAMAAMSRLSPNNTGMGPTPLTLPTLRG